MEFNAGMIRIIKTIDDKKSDVWCTTIEGARAMVDSNPDKYSFPVEIIEQEQGEEKIKRKYTKRSAE